MIKFNFLFMIKLFFKIFVTLIAVYFFFQCNSGLSSYEAEGYSLIGKFGEKMHKKYAMKLVGIGGGSDKQCFNLLCVTLVLQKDLNLEDSRKILIDCTNDFLDLINNSQSFKPYKKDNFTSQNLNLIIICQENEEEELYYPYVNSMACIEGTMKYAFCYKTDKGDNYEMHKETYEEAIAILQQNKMNSD